MMSLGRFETSSPTKSGKLGAGLRVLGLLVLGCSAASATVLLYPGRGQSTEETQPAPRPEGVPLAAVLSPAKAESKPGAAPAASPVPATPGVRQIPLTGGVDPTPPTLPKAVQAPPALAISAPVATITSSHEAPVGCLPQGLRSVLQDVQARFGGVTLVSTTELHTDNHAKGSTRHKLHGDCKAVDFKVQGDLTAVVAYLRTRSEVAGINTYRNNGVIHIDAAAPRTVAQR